MSQNTQDLLKKINYIEADIEIQKQILFSIPSDNKSDMEKILKIIARKKKDIEQLRDEIKKTDPKEFARIMIFETAINDFKKIAAENKFKSIVSKNIDEECNLALKDKTAVECLIKACDENGDWTIITLEGKIIQFAQSEVSEAAEQPEQLVDI